MINKKFKPLISLPPTEGFDYLQRMMFKKSEEEMSRKIPIIVIPEEAKGLRDEVQQIANDNGVEVAIIGMGDSGKPKTPNLLSFNYSPSCTTEKNHEEKQRGVSFSFNELVKDVEPTIPFIGRLVSSKEQFLENKKPKKERVKNNRKTKKRKKLKMEGKQESRIAILDRLSVKYGKHFEVDNFAELLKMCGTTTIILVTRLAMQEYERQGTKSMYSKSEVAKICKRFESEVGIGGSGELLKENRNKLSYSEIQQKWLEENIFNC